MLKYGRILSPNFLEVARKFSSKLRGLVTKGIAIVRLFFLFTLLEILFILIMKLILIVNLLLLYNEASP